MPEVNNDNWVGALWGAAVIAVPAIATAAFTLLKYWHKRQDDGDAQYKKDLEAARITAIEEWRELNDRHQKEIENLRKQISEIHKEMFRLKEQESICRETVAALRVEVATLRAELAKHEKDTA